MSLRKAIFRCWHPVNDRPRPANERWLGAPGVCVTRWCWPLSSTLPRRAGPPPRGGEDLATRDSRQLFAALRPAIATVTNLLASCGRDRRGARSIRQGANSWLLTETAIARCTFVRSQIGIRIYASLTAQCQVVFFGPPPSETGHASPSRRRGL